MPSIKGCKNCKSIFDTNSSERNYRLHEKYGFTTEDKFRKHNSGNKKCPYKQSKNKDTLLNNIESKKEKVILKWHPPKSNIELISEDDYVCEQEMTQLKLKKHNNGGAKLWFNTTEDAAYNILNQILSQISIQWITLVAEPGSGKTMVAHLLIYAISKLPYNKSISSGSITITTGMSDKEWYKQIIDNFKLRDGKFLWEELNKVNENNCIVHRSNFHKRISYLCNNQDFLNNHVFIIDESHFADESDMTIDIEFKRLGLTEDKMKEYNIKIIFISATPDVNLSIMNREDNHKLVQLQNGDDYKGFAYYNEKNMIYNYDDFNDFNELKKLIISKWETPRYHYIRARTQQEKGEYRNKIMNFCKLNNWILIEDDSDNDIYLSFKSDDNEKNATILGKKVIKAYIEPYNHTFILIKNKYQASKRLKLTSYTGLISEKPSKKRNTTITSNGLIPRFFGYEPLPKFNNDKLPLFLCDKKSVDEYIKFSKDFIYKGKDYTSNKINSDMKKLKELKNTCYCNIANLTQICYDSDIEISVPFNNTDDIQNYLLDNCGFRKASIRVEPISFTNKNKDNVGHIYPKRNVPEHTLNNVLNGDTFLTEKDYTTKYKNKGSGAFINRKGKDASGQCFMIYPVYKNKYSKPEEVKYYVHSLKF